MKLKIKKTKIQLRARAGVSICNEPKFPEGNPTLQASPDSEKLESDKSPSISCLPHFFETDLERENTIEEYGFSNLVSNGYGSNYNGGYDSY